MSNEMSYGEVDRLEAVGDVNVRFVMDEETFRGFYDRNARGVCAYLARVTGDRQLAEDLLQEAFYRFLRAAATHESEAHRRNSLYRIATNLAADARRRKMFLLQEADVERVASGSESPEVQTDVKRAMAKLKPRERAMLWLAYAEGASHKEIAEVLGVGMGSIKPLLFRARRRLAELLK